MGCCCSPGIKFESEEDKVNHYAVEKKMKIEEEKEKRTLRILLLGPGDSGKTTVLKQMRKIHNGEIIEEERLGLVAPIREAVLSYMVILCQASVALEQRKHPTNVDKELETVRSAFATNKHTSVMEETTLNAMMALWNDEGIKNTLALRSMFQIADNVGYFLDKVADISKQDYCPTFDDYVRFRMRTTGYNKEEFEATSMDGREYIFEFVDVGGQRAERRKWLHLVSDNISAVLYIMAIAEYDMMLFEDETVRRLDEALTLFEELMQRGFFESKSVVIFFNKYDLFFEKIKTIPITAGFPDFPVKEGKDPHNAQSAVDFIFSKFEAIYHKQVNTSEDSDASLHFHCTTALQTDHIEKILRDIQTDLIRGKLKKAGYI